MDETTKEQRAEQRTMPRYKWHGSTFWLLRALIGLIILVIVFWFGVKVGEFHSVVRRGFMGHGYYGGMMGRGYYGYPPGYMMPGYNGTSTPQGQYFPLMMRGYYSTTTQQ